MHTDVRNDYLHIRSRIDRDSGCIRSVVGQDKRNLCGFTVDGELSFGLSHGESSYEVEVGAFEGNGITGFLASKVGNLGDSRQCDDEVLLTFDNLFAITDGHTASLCRFGHVERNLVARVFLELVFEDGVTHGEDDSIHEVEVIALDGEQVTRFHFCRSELVDADRFGVCDVAGSEKASTGILEFNPSHFGTILGDSHHNASFAENGDVGHFDAAWEDDAGDLVKATAHKANLSSASHGTGTECIERDASLILIGVELVVLRARNCGKQQCADSHQRI